MSDWFNVKEGVCACAADVHSPCVWTWGVAPRGCLYPFLLSGCDRFSCRSHTDRLRVALKGDEKGQKGQISQKQQHARYTVALQKANRHVSGCCKPVNGRYRLFNHPALWIAMARQ